MAGLLPGEGPGVEGPRISWALARSLSRARACQGIEGGYVFQRMLPRWRAAAREVPFTSCRDPQPPAREQAFRVPARPWAGGNGRKPSRCARSVPSRGCTSPRSRHTLASCWSAYGDQRRMGTPVSLALGMSVATRPQVVIVGGGFGGLACARKLDGRSVDVLLVDGHNYHLFTPLLYQVATALLNPSDIVYPFRTIFRRSPNVRFRQAYVTRVDFATGIVHPLA